MTIETFGQPSFGRFSIKYVAGVVDVEVSMILTGCSCPNVGAAITPHSRTLKMVFSGMPPLSVETIPLMFPEAHREEEPMLSVSSVKMNYKWQLRMRRNTLI